MRFTVLRGSVGVDSDRGDAIALGGSQQRRLLAGLLADHNQVVSADRLVDALWPDGSAPEGARRTVMSYVSRLRSAIGEERVLHSDAGYSLALDGSTYDAAEFEARLADARDRAPADALIAYDEALALWSGRAFGEDADEWWLRPVAVRLEELRLVATEERAECLIDIGRHAEAVAELEALVAEHPLRERFVALSMRALYLGGRHAEALRAYRRYYDYLGEETGLEPSEGLIDLERRITLGDPSLAPSTGLAVPGYEMAEVIGEGAFGAVYRAIQPSVGREVAIKVVRPELADDPRFVQRFEAEAQLVARLEHPHVVPLYDFWRQPGGAYLVFRLLRGGSLADLLADGALPLERVTQLVDEIGGALNAAHALGVVHRDVKPANVLYDEAGNSYLADFGISVTEGTDEELDLRSAGSPMYASPEQARDGVASAASDQYSLAVLVWEALAGRPPFVGATATEVLRAKLGVSVPPITEIRPDLPESFDAVLAVRGPAPNPSDRYDSTSEFVHAWHAALATVDAVRTTGRLGSAPMPRTTSQTIASVQVGGTNPYKGLRAFREADASEFQGRDELVAALVARVKSDAFVAVVGPSGSGKSSLVHAGLVPALRASGALVVSMVPGSDPLAELEAALRRVATTDDAVALRDRLLTPDGLVDIVAELAPGGAELVLVVDQFEELWTLVQSDRARDRFTELLVRAAEHQGSITIVVTLRADLYDRPLQHPALGPVVRDATFAVTPMSASELQQAIVVPAEGVGVRFEPGLVATIVDDVVSRAGALPLLQFTLTELYEQRTGATVTAEAYAELGGVGGALACRAEQLYDGTAEERRMDVRRLFTQLVTPGDEGDNLRRRATMPELADVAPEIIDRYRANRLLVLDHHPLTREPTIEVAHEALLREWPRLREWIDEDRDAIRIRRLLTQSAAEWQEHGRDESELYRGTRLAAADEVAARLPLATTEREFLGASRQLADRERVEAEQRAATQSRQNRRLRSLLGATALLLVVALVTGIVAFAQRRRADQQARDARAVSVSAEVSRAVAEVPALLERDRSLALLLAVQAQRLRPDAATNGALLAALLDEPRLRATLVGGVSVYSWVAAYPDGNRVVLLGRDGADIWDVPARQKVGTLQVPSPGVGITVSPDGSLIAAGSGSGVVTLWDARTFQTVGDPLDVDAAVTDVAFVADGERLAVSVGGVQSTATITPANTDAMTAHLWDVDTHRRLGALRGHAKSVNAFASSSDGSVLAAGDNDGLVVFHNPRNGAPVGRSIQLDRSEGVYDIAFSADGRWLGVGTFGREGLGRAHVFDRTTGVEVATLGGATLMTVAFSADSKQLVTSGESVDVWSTTTWQKIGTEPIVTQHGPPVVASAHDTELVLSSFDGGLTVWDPNGLPTIANVLEGAPPAGGTFSPDGKLLAVAGNDDTLALYRADDLELVRKLSISGAGARALLDGATPFAFSPDSRVVAIVDRFGNVQLFDTGTARAIGEPIVADPDAVPVILAFSPDGRTVVSTSNQATVNGVHVIDVGSRRVRGVDPPFPHPLSATFRPDGTELVVTTAVGGAARYPVSEGEIGRGTILNVAGTLPEAAAFSPDGKLLAIGRVDGTLSFLDTATFEQVGNSVPIASGLLASIAWSADGQFVAVQDVTTANSLVDVAERACVGDPFPSAGLFGVGGFAPDGRAMVLSGPPGTTLWDLDVTGWPDKACTLAGRDLTPVEWDTYFSATGPHRPTCG